MLSAALAAAGIGAAIGAGFALVFWALAALGLDRINQGLLGSAGLAGLILACLAADGWILFGVLGFTAGVILLSRLQSALR